MKITLRKALKLKTNKIGDVKALKEKLEQSNTQHEQIVMSVEELSKTYDLFLKESENLIRLKTEITKANVGNYENIVRLEETKGLIEFYKELIKPPTFRNYDGSKYVIENATQLLTRVDLESKIESLKVTLEELLDKIDYYNTTTTIEVEFL